MKPKNTTIFHFMTLPDHLFPENIQENDLQLGLRLKELLSERRLTGQWLAEQVGVSAPSISKILSGRSRPRMGTFNKIAHAIARSPAEEQELIEAYHGLIQGLSPMDRKESYHRQISEDAWAAKQQIVKVMENRAYQADFRASVESVLQSLKVEYKRDYAENGVATDFLVSVEDETIAIECRPQIHRQLAQTFGFAYLVSERLGPAKVFIVTAFDANITRPEDMPESISMLSLPDLKEALCAVGAETEAN